MGHSTVVGYSGLGLFKELQTTANDGRYVLQEENKSLISKNDKDRLDSLFHQTSTTYTVGDVIKIPEFPSYYCLECVESGTTNSTAPDFKSIYNQN